MRVKDFEEAIKAFDERVRFYIHIDEMRIGSGNQVKSVYAHDRHWFFMWDEFGRGYVYKPNEDEGPLDDLPMDPRSEVKENDWERKECFDLEF